jgi:hypothetical protein
MSGAGNDNETRRSAMADEEQVLAALYETDAGPVGEAGRETAAEAASAAEAPPGTASRERLSIQAIIASGAVW